MPLLSLIRTRSNSATSRFRHDHGSSHVQATPWIFDHVSHGPVEQCRATSTMEYFGREFNGVSHASYVVTYHPDSAPEPHESGWFDGHETFIGSVAGNEGAFVLRSSGEIRKGKVSGEWTVLEGTGREGLVGIRGSGWFEYKLKDARLGRNGKGGMTVEFDEDKTAL